MVEHSKAVALEQPPPNTYHQREVDRSAEPAILLRRLGPRQVHVVRISRRSQHLGPQRLRQTMTDCIAVTMPAILLRDEVLMVLGKTVSTVVLIYITAGRTIRTGTGTRAMTRARIRTGKA